MGEYVLVTKYSDKDPMDPWYISFVDGIIYKNDKIYYTVEDSSRLWPCCFRISRGEASAWFARNGVMT